MPYGTYPLQAVSPFGHIVSAMSRPYAVHSDHEGKRVRLTREFTPVPVDDEERAQRRANIEFRMWRAKSDLTWNGPEIPREKPPIDDVSVGLDVFEPDGRYVGQIRGPRELTLFVRRGNTVWGVVRDEDDVPAVVRLRVDPGM